MRLTHLAACLALVLAAGCLHPAAPADGQPPVPAAASSAHPTVAPPQPPNADPAKLVAQAPDLPLGLAWTYSYQTDFTPRGHVTVVVAQKSADGYLFAGSAEADLLAEAIHDVAWLGPHDRSLNDLGSAAKAIQFPLTDGAGWEYTPGRSLTAHAARVATPNGPEAGFTIDGAAGGHTWHFEYAPSVGYFTRYLATEDGEVDANLTLESVGTASSYAWMSSPVRTSVGGNTPDAGALVADAASDRVFATAYVAEGSHVALDPPPGSGAQPWMPAPGAEPIQSIVLPGSAGAWSLAAVPPALGFAGLAAAATHVMAGTVGDGRVPAAPEGTLMNGAPDSAAVHP
jgi:hypothetical protein